MIDVMRDYVTTRGEQSDENILKRGANGAEDYYALETEYNAETLTLGGKINPEAEARMATFHTDGNVLREWYSMRVNDGKADFYGHVRDEDGKTTERVMISDVDKCHDKDAKWKALEMIASMDIIAGKVDDEMRIERQEAKRRRVTTGKVVGAVGYLAAATSALLIAHGFDKKTETPTITKPATEVVEPAREPMNWLEEIDTMGW